MLALLLAQNALPAASDFSAIPMATADSTAPPPSTSSILSHNHFRPMASGLLHPPRGSPWAGTDEMFAPENYELPGEWVM
jgi:hypothetical protein